MTETENSLLLASKAHLLKSLIELCKAIWNDECMNQDCEKCWIGGKKKELKEYFYIYSEL